MKRFVIFMVVCFCLLLSARPASAAYMTGSDLLRACEGEKTSDTFICMGYVSAVIDYQVMQQSLGTDPPAADFCLPEDLPAEKASVIVLVYLRKNPQLGTFIAAPSVAMALHEAYPCGAAAPRKKHHHGG